MLSFIVTDIELDFDDDYPESDQWLDTESVLGTVYDVEDEEFLCDVISDEIGWCIRRISYRPYPE